MKQGKEQRKSRWYLLLMLVVLALGTAGIWVWYATRPTVYTPAVMYNDELYILFEDSQNPKPISAEKLEEKYTVLEKEPFTKTCSQTSLPNENGMTNRTEFLALEWLGSKSTQTESFSITLSGRADTMTFLDRENMLLYKLTSCRYALEWTTMSYLNGEYYEFAIDLGPAGKEVIEKYDFYAIEEQFTEFQGRDPGRLFGIFWDLEWDDTFEAYEGATTAWPFVGKQLYGNDQNTYLIIEISENNYWYLTDAHYDSPLDLSGTRTRFQGKIYEGCDVYTERQFQGIQEDWNFVRSEDRTEWAALSVYEDCPVYVCKEGYPEQWWPETIIVETEGLSGEKEYVVLGPTSRDLVFPKKV